MHQSVDLQDWCVMFSLLQMNRLSGRALGVEEALHKRDRVGVQDFVLLENFQSESAFVENLEKRFSEDIIYVSNYTLHSICCLRML